MAAVRSLLPSYRFVVIVRRDHYNDLVRDNRTRKQNNMSDERVINIAWAVGNAFKYCKGCVSVMGIGGSIHSTSTPTLIPLIYYYYVDVCVVCYYLCPYNMNGTHKPRPSF